MQYRITCSDNSAYFYDNLKNRIYDDKWRKLDIGKIAHLEKTAIKPFQGFVKGKDRELRALKIQMGLKCNLNCSYCQQRPARESAANDKLPDWKPLVESLKTLGVKMKKGGKVEFWGGEPLVYFKTLQGLVPALRELYPDTAFSILTNGTLLNPRIARWLAENRVGVIVSHDAQGYSLRDGNDPIKDPKLKSFWLYTQETVRKNKDGKFGFNVVITKKNADLMEIARYFKTQFSEHAKFGFEGIVEAMSKDDELDQEAFDKLRTSVLQAMFEDDFVNLQQTARGVLMTLVNETPAEKIRVKCEAPDSDVLVVDLNGKVLSCQNYTAKEVGIGDMGNYDEIASTQFTHFLQKSKCRNCCMASFCKGGCPLTPRFSCRNDWMFWFCVFNAVWFLIFQKQIVGIETYDKSNN